MVIEPNKVMYDALGLEIRVDYRNQRRMNPEPEEGFIVVRCTPIKLDDVVAYDVEEYRPGTMANILFPIMRNAPLLKGVPREERRKVFLLIKRMAENETVELNENDKLIIDTALDHLGNIDACGAIMEYMREVKIEQACKERVSE